MASSLPAFWNVAALQPLAGLVLAAWDDEFLTPAELLSIREAIEQADGSKMRQASARGWLDPEAPPPASALRALERALAQPAREEALATTMGPQARSWQLHVSPAQQGLLASLDGPRARQPVPSVSVRAFPARRRSLAGGTRSTAICARSATRRVSFADRSVPGPARGRDACLSRAGARLGRVLTALSVFEPGTNEQRRAPPNGRALFCDVRDGRPVRSKLGREVRRAVRLVRQRDRGPGHGSSTNGYCADAPQLSAAGLLRHDRARARLERARHRDASRDYDAKTREFVINTPQPGCGQGMDRRRRPACAHGRGVRAAEHARTSSYGVHAFIVPIRDDAGRAVARRSRRGLRPQDGPQRRRQRPALVRPRARTARQRCSIASGRSREDGSYKSPIPSESKRFFVMLGTLVGGRINVAGGALAAAKTGLTIALRYGAQRTQFPDKSGSSSRSCDYQIASHAACCPRSRTLTRSASRSTRSCSASRKPSRDPEHARDTEMLANGLEGDRHLARDPYVAAVPRVLRRPGLPDQQSPGRAAHRHRRVHHVRGRQHRAAAARGEGSAPRAAAHVPAKPSACDRALVGSERQQRDHRAQPGRHAAHR